MIAFAAPAWLAALAALAVPLAIHLWSHRARRPVRVGSIRLLSGMPPAAARALRLRDPWLLALRLGMLAALALSLARPHWAPRGQRPTTWALLSNEALRERTLIDSLRAAGAELRFLDDGRWQMADGRTRPASGSLPSARCGPPSSLPSAICPLPHYWSLLAEADRVAPAGTRFLVAAPLSADRFRGTRPAITTPTTWREVPVVAPPPAGEAPGPPRRVVLLADAAHRDDARYVEAAIEAAATIAGPAARVARGSPDDSARLVAGADWIVWLASDRAASRTPVAGAPLWSDSSGATLLSVARAGAALVYRFHARLTPERALAPGFAESVAALWMASGTPSRPAAPRMALGQALPATATVPARRRAPAGGLALGPPLWIIAALALAVDRWLAWRRARRGA